MLVSDPSSFPRPETPADSHFGKAAETTTSLDSILDGSSTTGLDIRQNDLFEGLLRLTRSLVLCNQ